MNLLIKLILLDWCAIASGRPKDWFGVEYSIFICTEKKFKLISHPEFSRIWVFFVLLCIHKYESHDLSFSSQSSGTDSFSGEVTLSHWIFPFLKGIYSKRKEFASIGNKLFLFKSEPFQKGVDVPASKQEVKNCLPCQKCRKIYQVYSVLLTLSASNFRRHLSSVLFFYFNKLSFGKTLICKVERLNVKQCRSRWDGSLSCLFWSYAVCKSMKELSKTDNLIKWRSGIFYSCRLDCNSFGFF